MLRTSQTRDVYIPTLYNIQETCLQRWDAGLGMPLAYHSKQHLYTSIDTKVMLVGNTARVQRGSKYRYNNHALWKHSLFREAENCLLLPTSAGPWAWHAFSVLLSNLPPVPPISPSLPLFFPHVLSLNHHGAIKTCTIYVLSFVCTCLIQCLYTETVLSLLRAFRSHSSIWNLSWKQLWYVQALAT